MWELDYKERWVLKNWCFWTVVLEKTLESPLDCKEIQPVHPKRDQSWDWSLKGLILKLKLQYFGHLMRRVDSFEKTLMLGGTGGRRRRGWQRMRWLNGITDSMDMGLRWTPGIGNGQGGLECCSSWGRRVGHDWVTELNCHYRCCKSIYCVLLYIDAELWNMFLNIIWNFIKNLD